MGENKEITDRGAPAKGARSRTAARPSQQHVSQHKAQLFSAILLVVLGCGLLSAGFVVPPMGVIDSSILIAFGEILTFVGALFGIDYHYKAKGHNL